MRQPREGPQALQTDTRNGLTASLDAELVYIMLG